MQFSDTTNKLGLIEDVTSILGGVNTTDYTTKDRTRSINEHQRKVWHAIFKAYGGWRYNDDNQTGIPQVTDDLASGTATYTLPTSTLTIYKVEIKDSNSNWLTLTPLTAEEINESQAIDDFKSSNGTPAYYRLVGDTIELFPAPDYASTGGIKFYIDQDMVNFASTDTTKTPGFASPYHRVLSIGCALDYAKSNEMQSVVDNWQPEYDKYMRDIVDFYFKRWRDRQPQRIRVADAYETYR